MKPAVVNLPIIWRACDWAPITLRWKNANGDPINLTNWFPICWSTQFNMNATITDAVNGVTQITLDRDTTINIKLGQYRWNWIWTYSLDPKITTPPVLAGTVEVKNPIIPPPPAP